MAIEFRSGNTQLHDYKLKQEVMTVRVKVVGTDTPANKTLETNAPGVAYIAAQGQLAAANAVEDLTGQFSEAAADATGKYSVLIDDPDCKELLKVVATAPGSDTVAITGQKLTTGGRPLIALDSNSDLSNATPETSEVILEIHYVKK